MFYIYLLLLTHMMSTFFHRWNRISWIILTKKAGRALLFFLILPTYYSVFYFNSFMWSKLVNPLSAVMFLSVPINGFTILIATLANLLFSLNGLSGCFLAYTTKLSICTILGKPQKQTLLCSIYWVWVVHRQLSEWTSTPETSQNFVNSDVSPMDITFLTVLDKDFKNISH